MKGEEIVAKKIATKSTAEKFLDSIYYKVVICLKDDDVFLSIYDAMVNFERQLREVVKKGCSKQVFDTGNWIETIATLEGSQVHLAVFDRFMLTSIGRRLGLVKKGKLVPPEKVPADAEDKFRTIISEHMGFDVNDPWNHARLANSDFLRTWLAIRAPQRGRIIALRMKEDMKKAKAAKQDKGAKPITT
jgi:uncharacterized protein (DUF736 family)